MVVARCAHCDRDFSDDLLSTKRFVSKLAGRDEEEVVEITDAVKKLFEWKCNGKRRYKIEKKLQVCHQCGLCIGKLYGAIELFEYLRKPASYISKGLQTDEAEAIILRCKDEVSRKPSEVNIVVKGTRVQNTNASSTTVFPRQNFRLVDAEDDGGLDFNDFSMVDDPEDADYDPSTENKDVKHRRNEGEAVILGVDDAPPSPRAAAAPIVDLEHKAFLCQLCPKGFGTNQGLRTHLLLTHEVGNKKKEHVCTHCGKSYFYEYLLKNHSKVHSDEKPVECPTCPSRFKSKLALVHHQKNVHAASDRPFKCTICDRSYKEARSLREHVNINHNATGPVFKCKYECGSTTSRKRSMLSHYRRCRKRPGAENDPPGRGRGVRNARKAQGGVNRGRGRPRGAAGRVAGRTKKTLIPCKWDCGKSFKDKKLEMRHNVYHCNRRPQKQKPVGLDYAEGGAADVDHMKRELKVEPDEADEMSSSAVSENFVGSILI